MCAMNALTVYSQGRLLDFEKCLKVSTALVHYSI